MKSKKWFTGILATVFALSLAGAASAQGGVCGRGQGGGGRGVCVQSDQSQASSPNYQRARAGEEARAGSSACGMAVALTIPILRRPPPHRLQPPLTKEN